MTPEEMNEKMSPMFHEMALDICKQRKRLGGDWAIAQAVFSQAQRDQIRKIIGPDLIFMVLNLTKECQGKRLENRHAGDDEAGAMFADSLKRFYDLYEPAGENEENALIKHEQLCIVLGWLTKSSCPSLSQYEIVKSSQLSVSKKKDLNL